MKNRIKISYPSEFQESILLLLLLLLLEFVLSLLLYQEALPELLPLLELFKLPLFPWFERDILLLLLLLELCCCCCCCCWYELDWCGEKSIRPRWFLEEEGPLREKGLRVVPVWFELIMICFVVVVLLPFSFKTYFLIIFFLILIFWIFFTAAF